MEINFNVTGNERKTLVTAMGEILEIKPKYLGMPSAAYSVGGFTVDKHGTVSFDDEADAEKIETLLEQLADRGIAAGSEEVREQWLSARERELQEQPESTAIEGLIIEMPRDDFTDIAIENLKKLVTSKAALIKKALGVDNLPIEVAEDKVCFPWFHPQGDAALVRAYTKFVTALCNTAKEQKRITAKEKPVDNEKYAFRCFLLRLGFIGEEYKADRKILLRNLSGNSSFKSGSRKAQDEEIPAETVSEDLAEALADTALIHAVNASFEEGTDE